MRGFGEVGAVEMNVVSKESVMSSNCSIVTIKEEMSEWFEGKSIFFFRFKFYDLRSRERGKI